MRAIPRQRAGVCHWTLSRPAAALGGAAVGAVAMLLGATEGALAQEPRATAAEPAIVRLAAGWTPAEVLLRGAAFDAIRSIAVTDARGQDIAGTDVRIVQRGSDWIRIVVSVDDRALDRTSGFLTLVTEDARIASSIEVWIDHGQMVRPTPTPARGVGGVSTRPVPRECQDIVIEGAPIGETPNLWNTLSDGLKQAGFSSLEIAKLRNQFGSLDALGLLNTPQDQLLAFMSGHTVAEKMEKVQTLRSVVEEVHTCLCQMSYPPPLPHIPHICGRFLGNFSGPARPSSIGGARDVE